MIQICLSTSTHRKYTDIMNGVSRRSVLPGSPYIRSVREFLDKWLPLHSDFDAFCIDHFDKLSRQFGSSWDLVSKQSLLICTIPSEHLIAALRHHLVIEPNALGELTEVQKALSPQEKERQALSVQLDILCEQKAQLLSQGQVNTELDEKIRNIKQQLRRTPQLQEGEVLDDRYRLLCLLGKGGFARVYQAYDIQSKTLVAAKVLHSEFSDDPRRLSRFERGARQMGQLNHPHIVRVLTGPAEHDGFHYFVMEYLSGRDLSKAMKDKSIDAIHKLSIIVSVASALQFAHQRNLIHRDVKPENILLDQNLRAKLSDFDLVWAADTTGGTNSKVGLGTYLYAAPEQLTDAGQVTTSADVYGLAMLAIFLLLGKIPVWFREYRHNVIYKLPIHQDAHFILDRATHSNPIYRPSMNELLRILVKNWPLDRPSQHEFRLRILHDQERDEKSLQITLVDPHATVKISQQQIIQQIQPALSQPINDPIAQQNVETQTAEPSSTTLEPAEQNTAKRHARVVFPVTALIFVIILTSGYFAAISIKNSLIYDLFQSGEKQLQEIEQDIQNEWWSSAIDKADSLINNKSFSDSVRQEAEQKKQKANNEQTHQAQFLKLQSAVSTSDLDTIIHLLTSIPSQSVYFKKSNQIYESAVPGFIERHLKNAISAREQGNCDVFREQINQVLNIDPSHQRALDEQAKPCESGQSTAVTPPKSSPPKEKKSRAQRPSVVSATAPAQPDASPTEVGAADALDVLTEAQSELVNGNYDKAIKLAQSVKNRYSNIAWRITGAAACRNKNLPLVNQSYQSLDNAARQYLIYVCQREGIVQNGKSFRIVE